MTERLPKDHRLWWEDGVLSDADFLRRLRKGLAHIDPRGDRLEKIALSIDNIEKLRAALMDITQGNGAFSQDNYQFACNVIEHAKDIARKALDGTYEIS